MSATIAVEDLRSIAKSILLKARQLRDAAGHDGRYDDGGASALEAQVACFLAGLDGRLPDVWKAYVEERQAAERRDFEEYRRLWSKYGGQRPRGDY